MENGDAEQYAKRNIYEKHLKRRIGEKRLDEVDRSFLSELRASVLAEGGRGNKRVNNIMTVVNVALNFAADMGVIDEAPRLTKLKTEQGLREWVALRRVPPPPRRCSEGGG